MTRTLTHRAWNVLAYLSAIAGLLIGTGIVVLLVAT